jgi:ankyrin repeat protein
LRALSITILTVFLSFCTSNNKALFQYINTYQVNKVASLIKKDPQLLYSFSDEGYTPIQQTIKTGNETMLDLLINLNAPLSLLSKKGESTLNIAIDSGYYNIIKKLIIQYKMDIHATDKRGFSPLRTAYEENKIEIMQLLMQHGAQKKEMFSSIITTPTDNILLFLFPKLRFN